MYTLTPTKDTGAVAKADSTIYAESGRTVTDEDLAAQVGLDGVNGAFIADFLSACLTHERCGAHLYRSVAGRTANPVLRARYEEFGREMMRHVEILENVIETSGGNPSYVSPLARAVEAADSKALEATFLGSGALDPVSAEMAILDAVLMAETVDHANWEALGLLADSLPNGLMKDALGEAVAEVEEQEDEHLTWARDMRARMTMLQASSSLVTQAVAKGEELVAQVRSWFSGDNGLDVPVRREPPRRIKKAIKKRAAAKKSTAKKKATAKKATAKKSTAKKRSTKKSATRKKAAVRKKIAAKKSTAKRKAPAKKTAAKKATAKKQSTAKKAASKKATKKKATAKKRAAKTAAKKRTPKKGAAARKSTAKRRTPAKKAAKKASRRAR